MKPIGYFPQKPASLLVASFTARTSISGAVLNAVGIRCGRILRSKEGIVSGGRVNRLIDGFCGERLPTVNLAHVDLTGGEQRPEQHGSGFCWTGARFRC